LENKPGDAYPVTLKHLAAHSIQQVPATTCVSV
jgi:hypothetical protein